MLFWCGTAGGVRGMAAEGGRLGARSRGRGEGMRGNGRFWRIGGAGHDGGGLMVFRDEVRLTIGRRLTNRGSDDSSPLSRLRIRQVSKPEEEVHFDL